MKVILISAKSQHGKDTVAQMMKNELESKGEKVLIIHFGDPVKWFAREYYNWDGKKDIEGRSLLQYIGTTMMRTYDDRYWGNIISKFIAANNDFTYAIIPDWRFFSEEQAISEYNNNLYTIRIERLNPDGTKYRNPAMTDEQFNHISETELDRNIFDWIITNRGSLDELHEKVKTIIRYFDSH